MYAKHIYQYLLYLPFDLVLCVTLHRHSSWAWGAYTHHTHSFAQRMLTYPYNSSFYLQISSNSFKSNQLSLETVQTTILKFILFFLCSYSMAMKWFLAIICASWAFPIFFSLEIAYIASIYFAVNNFIAPACGNLIHVNWKKICFTSVLD